MSKHLVCAFAVVIALVPIVNDLCGLDCIQPVAASCPLHHDAPTSPQTCKHDHRLASANVVQKAPIAAPLLVADAVYVPVDDMNAERSRLQSISLSHSPPLASAQSAVLRI